MQEEVEEIYKLFSKLILGDSVRQGTSTSIKNTLINIYTMDDEIQTLRYSRLSGILSVDIDRKLKATFFRMYSMDSFQLIFECQLYYGFQDYYRQITETVWAFEFLDGIIAFEFLNQKQGLEVEGAVKKHSHPMSEYFGILQERRKQEVNRKREESFFGKIKKAFTKDSKGVKEESKIMNVRKENSITFDQSTGKFENIPPQMEITFYQLGLTKKELQSKQTVRQLVEDMIDYKLIKEAADDPSATELRNTLKQFGLEISPNSSQGFDEPSASKPLLPIPPPLGILPLPPPPPLPSLTAATSPKIQPSTPPVRSLSAKADLLQQIRNGVKLRSVKRDDNKIVISMLQMDRDQRENMSIFLKKRMKERDALMRRKKAESDEDD